MVRAILAVLLISGCSTPFPIRYYGFGDVDFGKGKLLGPTPQDDLPFSECAPNASSQHPCVMMFSKDFFQFKQEIEDAHIKLNACESNSGSTD